MVSIESAVCIVADVFEYTMVKPETFDEMCKRCELSNDDVKRKIELALVGSGWQFVNRGLVLTNRVESVAYTKFVRLLKEELAR